MTTMSSTRKWNFSAGPGVLPESLIQQAQQDLWDLAGTGIQGVFHEFLDDRRGSLYHLSGCNLVDEPLVQTAYGC